MRYSGVIARLIHASGDYPVHLDLLEQASSLVARIVEEFGAENGLSVVHVPDSLAADGVLRFRDAVYRASPPTECDFGAWKRAFDVFGFFDAASECYAWLDAWLREFTIATIVDNFDAVAELFVTHREQLSASWDRFRGVRRKYPAAVPKNADAYHLLNQPAYRPDIRALTLASLRNLVRQRRVLGRCWRSSYARTKQQALDILAADNLAVLRAALGTNTIDDLARVYAAARGSVDRGFNVTLRGSVCDGYYRAASVQWIAGAVLPPCDGTVLHALNMHSYSTPLGTDRETGLWVHDQLRSLFFVRPPTLHDVVSNRVVSAPNVNPNGTVSAPAPPDEPFKKEVVTL